MGFQGELNSVSLGDIFQTLHMNRQTGTLSVLGGDEPIHIWFDQGLVAGASAPPAEGRPFLINTLLRRGLVPPEVGEDILRRIRSTGQNSRDLLLATNALPDDQLDEISTWCIEEVVCPLFDRRDGTFSFTDGEPINDMAGPHTVWLGARIQTPQLVLEATRRRDEWQRIRDVIPDESSLFIVDADGRTHLKSVQTDPEMLKVLRYLDGRHTLDQIAQIVGVTRFDTWAITAQLINAQVARPRGQQEIVEDAIALRQAGDLAKARDLLDLVARSTRVAEVLRPLAEISAELKQVPRAVEIFLELIQHSQDAGDLETALADLSTTIDLSPDDPDLLFERAQILSELGRVDESAEGFVAASQAFLGTKDIQRAIDACHRAKNLMPRSPEPHRYLAKAYLMEGLTDNATVEYKALWHALLTGGRPGKALSELNAILDADCKYQAVKDQVIAHAQSSEAVKTSRAVRMLVYASAIIVVIAGAIGGYEYYRREVVAREGQTQVSTIKAEYESHREEIPHAGLIARLADLQEKYGSTKEVGPLIEATRTDIQQDFESRAQAILSQAQAQTIGGQFDRADDSLRKLRTQFAGTKAASRADEYIERLRSTKIDSEVIVVVDDAKRRWKDLDWDGAYAQLQPILRRDDLPIDRKNEYTALNLQWSSAMGSAQDLLERARAIRAKGDRRSAITALRRATGGQGDAVQTARQELAEVEIELINEIGGRARVAAERGDDTAAFAAVEEILAVAKQSTSQSARERALAVELPFSVSVDHPRTTLTLSRPVGDPVQVAAPDGATGRWSHRLIYRIGETVTVQAARAGHATASMTVSIQGRRSSASIALVRGPRWTTPMSGVATALPVRFGGVVLIGTDHNTVDVLDIASSTMRPIAFGDAVSPIRLPPVQHGGRYLTIVDGSIVGVDAATRSAVWTWPATGSRIQVQGPLCAHEHELIQGQTLIFAATARTLLIVAIDPAGNATPYQSLQLPAEVTAQPFVETTAQRTLLFVPVSGQILAYDIGAITERNPPQPYRERTIRTPGDAIGSPVRATVAGSPAVLYADSSGQVIAFDPTVTTDELRRSSASWVLSGTATTTPVVDGSTAYVSVAEGRIYALDLTRSGAIRWIWPQGAAPAPLIGQVAKGRSGIYAADAAGALICIDAARGIMRWRAPLSAPPASGPIASDGQVFVPLRQRTSPASGALVGFDEGDD